MERKGILVLLLCNYYVTYKCNAACGFCHFADHTKFKHFQNALYDDFVANVTQLSKMGVKFIDLTGGEPLLNKDIAKMAEFAKSRSMQTSITTNTLLYSKYAEKLAGKVNLLHFSLDSPDREEHNKIRKIECYDKVFESIEIAKSLGEFPDILFTVTGDTYHKLPQMHDIAIKKDLVLIVNPVFSYFGNPGLDQKAIDYIEEFCSGKKNLYINKAFLQLRKNGGNNIKSPSCKAVSRVIVISPDNKLILPCYHLGFKEIPINKPLSEIRNSKEYLEIKNKEGKFEFCEGCTVNCYFEPSFAFPTNRYGLMAAASKMKYGYYKLVKQMFMKNVKD